MFESLGGKRAVVLRAWSVPRVLLSSRRRFVESVSTPVQRLVFVCAGNICRSAYGEESARRSGLLATSMGLHASDGAPANPVAAARALRRGVDLSAHRARRLQAALCRPGDLLLAFEVGHAEQIERALQGAGAQVRLLGAFLGPLSFHQHDPFGLAETYFDQCFECIDACIANMALRFGAAIRESRP